MARVLLDECVDRGARGSNRYGGAVGWFFGLALLARADRTFDVFVTTDSSLPHQQNLARLSLRVIVLQPAHGGLTGLMELLPELERALDDISPGKLVHIGPPSR